jgi:hypothetical protein
MPRIGVSLGNVCASAIYGVQNNLRETKENGYKTCPFDLMVSNYNGLVQCIIDDFAHFLDLKYLVCDENGIRNTYYNFGFNHESPGHANLYLLEKWPEGTNHFVNNNFHHFITRYRARIQNFRNYLQNPSNHIVFIIQIVYDPKPESAEMLLLNNALKFRYPNLSYDIINI